MIVDSAVKPTVATERFVLYEFARLAVGGSLLMQLAVLYTSLNDYFGTVPLGLADWGILGALLLLTLPL